MKVRRGRGAAAAATAATAAAAAAAAKLAPAKSKKSGGRRDRRGSGRRRGRRGRPGGATIWPTRPRTSRSRSRSRTTRARATASPPQLPARRLANYTSRPPAPSFGAIAQLGERYNGIVEVNGSIPFGSTNKIKGLAGNGWPLCFAGKHRVSTVPKVTTSPPVRHGDGPALAVRSAATVNQCWCSLGTKRGFRTFRYPDSAGDGVAGTSSVSASEGVCAVSATPTDPSVWRKLATEED